MFQWKINITKMEELQRSEVTAEGQDKVKQHHLARMAHAV